jgi:hypothetical protein
MTEVSLSENPRGMEMLVLLRDECRALSSALELAMLDGQNGAFNSAEGILQMRALRRRAIELAGSLALWAGGGRGYIVADSPTQSIDQRIERFLDEQELRDELERRKTEFARLAYSHGERYGSALAELETERIESARLRDALERATEDVERLTLQLAMVRGGRVTP